MKHPVELPRYKARFGKAAAFLLIVFATTIARADKPQPMGDNANLSYLTTESSQLAMIPEPSTWAALILGASILMLRSRKRRA